MRSNDKTVKRDNNRGNCNKDSESEKEDEKGKHTGQNKRCKVKTTERWAENNFMRKTTEGSLFLFFVCSISFIQLLRNTAEVLTVSDFLRARGDSLKTDKMMMKV